mgnify:FL=1|jgi:hypothetical protein|tara:strand:+ start:67 stop:240 length:174 start_codon:yes stop_codon:yes gene_type:complete
MASNNLKQFLYNTDFELVWTVENGKHTIQLIEHKQNSDTSKMVGESVSRDTFTYTEE